MIKLSEEGMLKGKAGLLCQTAKLKAKEKFLKKIQSATPVNT